MPPATLIPPEAAEYAATVSLLGLITARQYAFQRYYETPLTVGDMLSCRPGTGQHAGAAAFLLAGLAFESELENRGLYVITDAGPQLGPDPALDPRPEDIPDGTDW